MTVKDLILAHEAEEVYPAYYTYYAKKEPKGSAKEQARYENFCGFFNKLRDREPVASDYLILAVTIFCSGKSTLGCFVYRKEDVAKNFDKNSPLKGIDTNNVDAMPTEEVKSLCKHTGLPGGPFFDGLSWAEVLGAEVSETNIHSVGSVQVLAAVLQELARYSFSEEQLIEDEKKISEAVIELLHSMFSGEPKEEQTKHFEEAKAVTIESGRVKLDDSSSEDEHTYTDEEWAAIQKVDACSSLRTAINEYNALLAYCQEHNI